MIAVLLFYIMLRLYKIETNELVEYSNITKSIVVYLEFYKLQNINIRKVRSFRNINIYFYNK